MYASRKYPITRDSITADINKIVAENAAVLMGRPEQSHHAGKTARRAGIGV